MKRISSKIVILISSIITGFLIANNVGLGSKLINLSLNSLEYKNAVEERNNLYTEIENIKNENIGLKYKIISYKGTDKEKKEKLIQDMKAQLTDYGNLSGINSVKGPGIIIKIQDGNINKLTDTQFEIWRKIFHENDMALVLNEIRKTSAEAIILNDHRILTNTGVSCYWAHIGFEDETMKSAPFYIYAIGDVDEIYAVLTSEDSYLEKLKPRGIKVEIEKKDEIIINQTNQNTEPKYMQRYN